jgi:serine/threonine-protein kinase
LREGNERLFRYMGSKRDKHVREHQLYAFGLHAGAPHPCQPAALPVDEHAIVDRPPSPGASISAEIVAAEERRLARYIGPLAKVIVRRAAESTQSLGQFSAAISAAVPDAADRASFLAGAPLDHRPRSVAPPPRERPEPSPAAPATLREDEVRQAERRLASHLGPLAGVLVRRAAKAAIDRQDLYARLGTSIADDAARAAFLAAAEVDA